MLYEKYNKSYLAGSDIVEAKVFNEKTYRNDGFFRYVKSLIIDREVGKPPIATYTINHGPVTNGSILARNSDGYYFVYTEELFFKIYKPKGEQENMTKENQAYHNKSFYAVRDFHQAFGHTAPSEPTVIPVDVAIKRASWTAEELVEFLHASVGGNEEAFSEAMLEFYLAIGAAVKKQTAEGEYEDKSDSEILVRQIDALTDISYFNYGSFVVAGTDPQPYFDIVQDANMGKLDRETGKPIIRESDGKIMKPDYWEVEFAPEPKLRKELGLQMTYPYLDKEHAKLKQ